MLRRILAADAGGGRAAARPGEMTLRAFLNGRIDLAQAEAVLASINAETDAGRRLALPPACAASSPRVCRRFARRPHGRAGAHRGAASTSPTRRCRRPDPAELAR